MLFLMFATDEPNGRQLPGDLDEVYWGTAAFVVLVALIWWKAGPAIASALRGRTERIQRELNEAKVARQEAEVALSASTADLPDIDQEADRLRSEAVDTAARLKSDLIDKAHADAEAMTHRAEADIENAKRQAFADLRDEVSRMTRGATEEVVAESLDDATHRDLIENYINQVSQVR